MGIEITRDLAVNPNPVDLPKRIDLRQTLRSNLASENITVVYSLKQQHDVWFVDGQKPPAKSFQRKETVGNVEKECMDRVVLQRGPGQKQANIEISQAITDSAGSVVTDVVPVTIRG